MALFPLQGIVEGDFVVLLVPVDDGDSMAVVGQKVRDHVLGRRLPETAQHWRVRLNGELLADETTVADAGCVPLDVVEVVRA